MPRILQQFVEASDIAYDIIKDLTSKHYIQAPQELIFRECQSVRHDGRLRERCANKPMCASNHQGASKIQRCDTPVRLKVQLEHWKYLRQK